METTNYNTTGAGTNANHVPHAAIAKSQEKTTTNDAKKTTATATTAAAAATDATAAKTDAHSQQAGINLPASWRIDQKLWDLMIETGQLMCPSKPKGFSSGPKALPKSSGLASLGSVELRSARILAGKTARDPPKSEGLSTIVNTACSQFPKSEGLSSIVNTACSQLPKPFGLSSPLDLHKSEGLSTIGNTYSHLPKKQQPDVHEVIGDRMKRYEQNTGYEVARDQYLVVRADGHHFSKVTAGFTKPLDLRITHAMQDTMADAMVEFGAITGYTQSDEITLVFPPCTIPEHVHPNAGRVQKLGSRVAGFVSVRFLHHLKANTFDTVKEAKLIERVNAGKIYFDARVISFPTKMEVTNHFVWRSLYDCVRNSVSSLARVHLGAKKCVNVNSLQMRQMLVEEKQRRLSTASNATAAATATAAAAATATATAARLPKASGLSSLGSIEQTLVCSATSENTTCSHLPTNITWEEQSPHFKYGSYCKRELTWLHTIDSKDKTPIIVQRFRNTLRAFPIVADDATIEMVFAKYWPEPDQVSTKVTSKVTSKVAAAAAATATTPSPPRPGTKETAATLK